MFRGYYMYMYEAKSKTARQQDSKTPPTTTVSYSHHHTSISQIFLDGFVKNKHYTPNEIISICCGANGTRDCYTVLELGKVAKQMPLGSKSLCGN